MSITSGESASGGIIKINLAGSQADKASQRLAESNTGISSGSRGTDSLAF